MKKTIALLLILLLAISAAACTKNEGGTKTEDGSQTSAAATKEAKPGIENVNPIGKAATATFEDRSGIKENATITVDEVMRGDTAFNFIQEKMKAKGGFWEAKRPDDENDEYLIAKITFTLNSFDEGDSKEPSTFYATDATGERYPSLLASMFYNNSDFTDLSSQTITVGQTVTAYEIFQVKKDDAKPLVAYRNFNQNNADGLWFNLYQ